MKIKTKQIPEPEEIVLDTLIGILSTKKYVEQQKVLKVLFENLEFYNKDKVQKVLELAQSLVSNAAKDGSKRSNPNVSNTQIDNTKHRVYASPQFFMTGYKFPRQKTTCCGAPIGSDPQFVWRREAGKTSEVYHSGCVLGNAIFMEVKAWKEYLANNHKASLLTK